MKNRQKLNYSCFSALFIILILFSCNPKKEKPQKIDPAFSAYIKSFTNGIVSNNSTIIIGFTEAILTAEPGKKADNSLFSISPSMKGQAYWRDNYTIEFKPENKLKSDQKYNIRFYLHKIKQVPEKLKTFEFWVQAKKQALNVSIDGMQIYDENNLQWQKIIGKINTADFANEDNVEKILTARQNNKKLNIHWEHNPADLTHQFTIDSVNRSNSKGLVSVKWDGAPIEAEGSDEQLIDIPPLGDFKVLKATSNSIPEQYITIYFSDPLDNKQDLEGLIYFDNNAKLNLETEGNEVRVYPESRFTGSTKLIVEDGIRNSQGYQLHSRFEKNVSFSSIKPQVELIGKGNILPSSNGLIFPFKAVNLSAVNVKVIKVFENNIPHFLQWNQFDGTDELKHFGRIVYYEEVPLKSDQAIDFGSWNTFALDLSEMIKTEPGAIYRVIIDFEKKHSLYPCNDEGKTEEEQTSFETKKELGNWDEPGYYYSDDYYDYDDDYSWREREDPCKASYYMHGNQLVARNVFASDLGIIAKGGNSTSLLVAVTDIKTTETLSDVSIELYNLQNQLITTAKTNARGIAKIDLEAKPFLLVAKKGNQIGYLRLDDGSSLSLSMFNVNGRKTTEGVKGFIYGERGVWRPGDSLYVSFILEDKNKFLPENHPVVFEMYTPENQLYLRKVKSGSLNGFYDFRTATEMSSPTGNWLAKVIVGGSSFTKTLKIETVKPNRLKIKLDFKTQILKASEDIKGEMEVKWLHGAVAKNLKSEVILDLHPSKTKFKDYEGFCFDDPSKTLESMEIPVFEGELDEKGIAKLQPEINVEKSAPGMLKASFKTKVFEKGGDFSVDRTTLSYSPYKSYVGVKIPEGEGWNKSLYSNEPNMIPIVTVDEEGNPVDRKGLKIEIFNLRWRWWWEQDNSYDLASYIRYQSSSRIKTEKIDTKDGKAMYEMDLNTRSWGRKLIRITDPVSGHSTGQMFYTSYRGWWNASGAANPGGAEMLSFKTDKPKYNVGETVKIELPDAKQGKALISIESGSRVIETYWVNVSKENHSFSFVADKEMAPNVYIHISFIQPHNQTANDLPIRLYGIEQINIEDPMTHLSPVIEMPESLEPEKKVSIKVSETNGKAMTYTLAVVDEGLLDLTNFKTPDAWSYFYAREALGIKTWDMYKYVMGAFTGNISGLMALGGGAELGKKPVEKANRFKPVVQFFGPIHLEPSSTNTHTFTMPNYIGSVKTMVVAGYEGAYGKTSKATPVKKPLMVLASFPRVVSPGEIVKLPVTVFAMEDDIKNVNIELQTNDFFKNKGGSVNVLNFDTVGEKMTDFELEVNEKIGVGRIKVIASSGKKRAEYDIELDVRLPNPRISNVIRKAIEPGQSWKTDFKAVGMKGTNNGMLEISSIPPLNLEKRLNYLIRYPHGCIEQTTSSIFPQLFLPNLLNLDDVERTKIENNIKAGIEQLKNFQLSNGGMTYWPSGYDYVSEWGTTYAGHFMLEAQARGYSLPYGFLRKWISYQQEKANEWTAGLKTSGYNYYSRQVQQAYRLFTLALAGKSAIGPMNRLRETASLCVAAKWRLAAAYYLAGREKIAEQIIDNLATNVPSYSELSYTFGSGTRDQAMILETLTLMGKKDKAYDVFKDIQEELNTDRWYSTQTTAYALMAISKFIGESGESDSFEFDYIINNGRKTSVVMQSPMHQQKLDLNTNLGGTLEIVNKNEQTLFARIYMDGIPLAGDATNAENNLRMSIRYLDMDGKEIQPDKLIQGTDFMAEVKVSHPGIRVDYREMALTQIFPSGWEIHNLRMDEGESIYVKDKPQYQDIRDDRVLTYFEIPKGKTRTFRVLLNASYLGKFYLPTVYCEAMYDNEINAHKAGRWVQVIKQPVVKENVEKEATETNE